MANKQPLPYTQRLFSYGTLQNEAVQYENFGRQLQGTADAVVGYILSTIEITDPAVVALSGENVHPIIRFTGNPNHTVSGSVFEISEAELQRADSYEIAAYQRVRVTLSSGLTAWAYVAIES